MSSELPFSPEISQLLSREIAVIISTVVSIRGVHQGTFVSTAAGLLSGLLDASIIIESIGESIVNKSFLPASLIIPTVIVIISIAAYGYRYENE